ncbi:MAG: alpha amylase C-terminal domain-containing protein, partial [bacterium]|nr:alpha amylase C-terminal domain-containing protein [bacterium]
LPGFWKEVLNSDADIYWGSNMGNDGGCWTNPWSHHGQPHSLKVTTPPLSVTVLKRFQ